MPLCPRIDLRLTFRKHARRPAGERLSPFVFIPGAVALPLARATRAPPQRVSAPGVATMLHAAPVVTPEVSCRWGQSPWDSPTASPLGSPVTASIVGFSYAPGDEVTSDAASPSGGGDGRGSGGRAEYAEEDASTEASNAPGTSPQGPDHTSADCLTPTVGNGQRTLSTCCSSRSATFRRSHKSSLLSLMLLGDPAASEGCDRGLPRGRASDCGCPRAAVARQHCLGACRHPHSHRLRMGVPSNQQARDCSAAAAGAGAAASPALLQARISAPCPGGSGIGGTGGGGGSARPPLTPGALPALLSWQSQPTSPRTSPIDVPTSTYYTDPKFIEERNLLQKARCQHRARLEAEEAEAVANSAATPCAAAGELDTAAVPLAAAIHANPEVTAIEATAAAAAAFTAAAAAAAAAVAKASAAKAAAADAAANAETVVPPRAVDLEANSAVVGCAASAEATAIEAATTAANAGVTAAATPRTGTAMAATASTPA
uniref:Uncharacterized protein n=1 Tax=Chlamydomonas euryale TaxID=1486919 RepID=A0A7R9YRC2_9CHLO